MGTSGKDRQAALAARRRAVGLVRVPVWVRADRKSELLDFAATLTEPAPIHDHDPRQLDLEDAIRATTTTAETENQVIDQATEPAPIRTDCDISDDIRAAVTAARRARGWTQRQLAEISGTPQASVARLEKCGTKRPTPAHVAPILAALGL